MLLASRSGRLGRDGQGLKAQLASLRAVALVKASDAATALDASCFLSQCGLVGVLHAAGVLRDKVLRLMATSDIDPVFSPKALAASHLHTVMAPTPLEALGFFSSVASTFGHAGQANYVAANAYLDALAQGRSIRGTIGSSLQIPAVSGAGMGAATFSKEQLDAVGAISLDGFAAWLAQCLIPGRATAERTQALLAPAMLQAVAKASSSRVLAEVQLVRNGSILTRDEGAPLPALPSTKVIDESIRVFIVQRDVAVFNSNTDLQPLKGQIKAGSVVVCRDTASDGRRICILEPIAGWIADGRADGTLVARYTFDPPACPIATFCSPSTDGKAFADLLPVLNTTPPP